MQFNERLVRKLQQNAECAKIMIGATEQLGHAHLSALVRLDEPWPASSITEVRLPTRYIFILIGSTEEERVLQEIGRAMATILNDEVVNIYGSIIEI